MIFISVSDRERLQRIISGALKNAVDAHGSITLANRTSATKRIVGELMKHGSDVKIDQSQIKIKRISDEILVQE